MGRWGAAFGGRNLLAILHHIGFRVDGGIVLEYSFVRVDGNKNGTGVGVYFITMVPHTKSMEESLFGNDG